MRRPIPLIAMALALALAMPVVAADVQLPSEPMSDEDTAAIDAGIAAIAEEPSLQRLAHTSVSG